MELPLIVEAIKDRNAYWIDYFSVQQWKALYASDNGTLCNLATKRGNRAEKQTALKTNTNSSGQLLTAPDRSKKECHPYFVATRNRNLGAI